LAGGEIASSELQRLVFEGRKEGAQEALPLVASRRGQSEKSIGAPTPDSRDIREVDGHQAAGNSFRRDPGREVHSFDLVVDGNRPGPPPSYEGGVVSEKIPSTLRELLPKPGDQTVFR
jgi:hypothetical protein